MKTLVVGLISGLLLVSGGTYARQDDQVEVPGDNFSLEGALELFKRSASPEEFEQLLNSQDSKVNNLDLNGDSMIDYIKVIDQQDGNVHIFILQALISQSERQDIAVIELEKLSNGKAVLQIVGDADIYGIETIIEPTSEVRVNAGTSTARTVVNVWAWPSVQYVYGPYYSVWDSPWGWSSYPMWWNPWRPVHYVVYRPYWASYRPYYQICHSPRIVYAHRMYRPMRSTSVIVYNRHQNEISRYRSSPRQDRSGYVAGRGGRDREGMNRSRERERSNNDRTSVNERRDRLSSNRTNNSERTNTRERTARTEQRDDSNDNRVRTERSGEIRRREPEGQRPQVSERQPTDRTVRTQRNPTENRVRTTPERSGGQRPQVIQRQNSPERRTTAPRSNGGGSERSGGKQRGGRD